MNDWRIGTPKAFFLVVIGLAAAFIVGSLIHRANTVDDSVPLGRTSVVGPINSDEASDAGGGIRGSRSISDEVPTLSADQPGSAVTLEELKQRWMNAELSLEGAELRDARIALFHEAREHLAGMDSARFLEFFYPKTDEETRFTGLALVLGSIFMGSSEENRRAKEWALNLEDPNLRRTLLNAVGMEMSEDEARAAIDQLDSHEASLILLGHCRGKAVTNGLDAVKTYIRLNPDGSDFSSLATLMAELPLRTDFESVDALIPNDDRHLAREARSALFRRWVKNDPLQVIEHVLNNQERISENQLGVVVGSWANREPAAAEHWMRSQNDTRLRTIAAQGISNSYQHDAPDRAWEIALEIEDIGLRERKLREIHSIWIRQDYDAAENARLSLDQ